MSALRGPPVGPIGGGTFFTTDYMKCCGCGCVADGRHERGGGRVNSHDDRVERATAAEGRDKKTTNTT